MNIGQPALDAVVIKAQPFVIEPEQVERWWRADRRSSSTFSTA